MRQRNRLLLDAAAQKEKKKKMETREPIWF